MNHSAMSRYPFISHDTLYTCEIQMKKEHEPSKLLTQASQQTKRKHKQRDNNKTTLAINSSSDYSKHITVYMTPQCSKCTALKLQLERLNVPYVEIDITDTDAMADLYMQNIVILTAPTLRIGNTFLTITPS